MSVEDAQPVRIKFDKLRMPSRPREPIKAPLALVGASAFCPTGTEIWLFGLPLEPNYLDPFVLRSASAAMNDVERYPSLIRAAVASKPKFAARLGIDDQSDEAALLQVLEIHSIQCQTLAVPGTATGPTIMPYSPAPDRQRCDFADTETSYAIVLRMRDDDEHLLRIEVRDGKYLNAVVD